jgi:hypothetical protein
LRALCLKGHDDTSGTAGIKLTFNDQRPELPLLLPPDPLNPPRAPNEFPPDLNDPFDRPPSADAAEQEFNSSNHLKLLQASHLMN